MPSDGQVFVDSYYVSWQWNIEDQLWHRLGDLNGIPVANENTTGLLSADLKIVLDSVAYADGGFGIILSKPAATIFGDIVLRSESFDIQPVDAFGNVIETSLFTASDDTLHSPGFKLSVSEEYLRSFCVEFVAPIGPDGPEGEVGDKGEDGFNDSPKGHLGLTGFDAEGFKVFSGVKLVDVDDLTSRAVVGIQLDIIDNALVVTKSPMNVAGSDMPADQLAAIPISRQLRFALGEGDCKSTLDDWTIVAPTGDPLSDDPDVYLLGVPDSVEIGDVIAPQFAKLSDLINGVTSVYKQKLMSCDNQWLKEARDFISSKDGLARDALSNLAQKLAECEFERPLEFSLGIIPPSAPVMPSESPEPDASVPPGSGGVLARTIIMAIYDESIPVYTFPTGTLQYIQDRTLWESLIDRVKSVFHCRFGILQTTPNDFRPLEDLKVGTERWPYDTDVQQIPVNNYYDGEVDSSQRVTADKILATYDMICQGGYVPTYMIFLMDDSGSMQVDDNYGGPPAVPGGDPPNLIAAKAAIQARNPSIIFLNTKSDSGERWIRDAHLALTEIIQATGTHVP